MIITAIDRAYIPGAVALHKSIQQNSPNHTLSVMAYGCEAEAKAAGLNCIPAPVLNSYLPPGEGTAENNAPMYARLLAPQHGATIWMDADQVVLGSLNELYALTFNEACACVPFRSLREQVRGVEVRDTKGIYSGLIVFNRTAWRDQRVTERCFGYMNAKDGAEYPYVVQSVLARVLAGNFHPLDPKWQGFANRKSVPAESVVLHWHGREQKPWTHPQMNHAEVWRRYA